MAVFVLNPVYILTPRLPVVYYGLLNNLFHICYIGLLSNIGLLYIHSFSVSPRVTTKGFFSSVVKRTVSA
jgi:hypothetical protein